MNTQKPHSPHWLVKIFLSWFYTGFAPKAPGTFGSLAALPFILLLHYLDFNTNTLLIITLSFYLAAVLITEYVQKKFHLHDPQWIVIDEVIGMLIAWIFIQKIDFISLSLIFILFRIFDIIKIWPASFFDQMHHGIGTITDDVISGIYAGLLTLLIRHYVLPIAL
jgi:phosphatidylglycerophosphatase A